MLNCADCSKHGIKVSLVVSEGRTSYLFEIKYPLTFSPTSQRSWGLYLNSLSRDERYQKLNRLRVECQN